MLLWIVLLSFVVSIGYALLCWKASTRQDTRFTEFDEDLEDDEDDDHKCGC